MANQKIRFNKKNREKTVKRSRRIVLAIGLTAIVLVVATYAWFIGITTVTVNPFEVNIVSTEGLQISLDGLHWEETLHVTKGIIEGTDPMYIGDSPSADKYLIHTPDGDDTYTGEYPGNTNHWAGAGTTDPKGLEPVSTVGTLLNSSSEVQFFAKTTMTSETGGYKLLAGDITSPTATAYIAFDVFLKNSSGSTYVSTYNKDNDEALFLQGNSTVLYNTQSSSAGQGIENSVRLGFFALGRVNANNATPADNPDATKKALIQGISCSGTGDTTSLCNLQEGESGSQTPVPRGYNWNIWEPNDKAHIDTAVTRFNHSCVNRTDATTYTTTACTPIDDGEGANPRYIGLANGKYIDTYAVNSAITTSTTPKVNIYDGLNTFTNTSLTNMTGKVLTSTENIDEATRNPLLYIAPASITKVRVYIWLEGQDVDNFDLATIYQTLNISFGFTKDRYEASTTTTPTVTPEETTSEGD